jgi:hypothetical protein
MCPSYRSGGYGCDLSRFISELIETCAGLYLSNQQGLIAFVHTVMQYLRFRVVSLDGVYKRATK